VFVVLTHNDELLEQVGQALDDAGEVRLADNEEEVRQFADPQHAVVMLVDARQHLDPALVVERLHASDGTTVIVVFARAEAVTDTAKAIKGSAAFAVLPIPIELEKTRAVLHGAGEEALARRALVSPRVDVASLLVAPEMPPPVQAPIPQVPVVRARPMAIQPEVPVQPEASLRPEPAVQSGAGGATPHVGFDRRIAVVVLAGLLVVAGVAWLYLRDGASAPAEIDSGPDVPPAASTVPETKRPAAVAASQPGQALSTSPKEALLDRARVAFHERRYTDPDGDNALYLYRSVLAQDPQDEEAREGLERIGAVLDARFRAALAERRSADAARTLEQLQTIRPADPALAAAATQLAEELARIDTTQRAERLSRLVSTRIRDGQLLGPPGDNAKYYFVQLRKLPDAKRLGAAAAEELARAYAERARRAAAQGQGAEAEQWLAEARELGYAPQRPVTPPAALATANPTPLGVSTAQRAAQAQPPLRTEIPAASAGSTATPETAGGTAPVAASRSAAPAAEAAPSAADFRRIRYVAPVYPDAALRRGQSGDVRVRLTVDSDGRVSDVQVLSATPAGVFERAAVNAVRKWRFEPIVRNGRAIEASVTSTISFRPDDTAKR
jgi:protein TonB